jgi:Fe2+ or Zn2+ uptake regulation protein
MTPQRLAILHVLHHSGKHLSPAQIYELAHRDLPGLTETTVYRTLEFLAENGFAFSAPLGNGHLVYQISSNDHHHLTCRSCNGEVEVGPEILESLYRKLESGTGYRLTDSHVTFFGLCPKCQRTN